MSELPRDTEKLVSADNKEAPVRSLYRAPVLNRLGTLRDLTMSASNVGANDGMPNKGTKRGGDFESIDDGR